MQNGYSHFIYGHKPGAVAKRKPFFRFRAAKANGTFFDADACGSDAPVATLNKGGVSAILRANRIEIALRWPNPAVFGDCLNI
jgi:hypothetical protein